MQFLKARSIRSLVKGIGAMLCCAGALSAAAGSAAAQPMTDERARVVAVADSALAAISRTDFVAFTDFMLDLAVTFSSREVDGKTSMSFRTRMQQRATQTNSRFTERGFRPEVQISGPLATVWMRYDFYTDGKFSHCGVDAFTMLKSDGRWRIATLVWSVEQPPACEKHPSGPPR